MSNGDLPTNPVCVKNASRYIGRVTDKGTTYVGCIHTGFNVLYYVNGSSQDESFNYEALVYPTEQTLAWIAHQGVQTVPNNAIEGGHVSGKSSTCHSGATGERILTLDKRQLSNSSPWNMKFW